MKRIGSLVAGSAMLAAAAAPAWGDGQNDLGIDVNALISTTYTYSFDRPADGIVGRVVDTKDSTFALDTAALFVSKSGDDSDFGFGIGLDFGDAAEAYSTAREFGDDFDGSDDFELREAFVTYNLPVAGISVKAGKFPTLLGYEVMKTNTAINHNISHSILFGKSIAFTHTGVLLSAPVNDQISVDLGVVNGWDNVDDNNSGKTLLGGVGVQAADNVSMYLAGTWGSEASPIAEGGAGASSKRGVVTLNTTIDATEECALVLDLMYGNETDFRPAGAPLSARDDIDWYGFAAYALYDVDQWSFALRAEVFDDEGVRGSFGSPVGERVTVWEVTPTIAYHLNNHVTMRAEYRHDQASDEIFFEDNGRSQDSWDTLAAEILVGF